MGQNLRFCEVLTDRVENVHRKPARRCYRRLGKLGLERCLRTRMWRAPELQKYGACQRLIMAP